MEAVQALITQGDIDGALREMHAAGVELTDAAQLLCREAGLHFGRALELIWEHPHWWAETEQTRPVMQLFWHEFEQVAAISDDGKTWVVDPEFDR
jgi:hypothetical protein